MNRSPSFFPPENTEALPRIFGKYSLLAKLASGGMADVYLALHASELGIEKLVVLKCLREHLREEVGFIGMFLDEARTASTLTHPNIVPVFDCGEIDGTHYIAMEYIEGIDLRQLRRARTRRRRPPMPLQHALHVIGRVLSGLEYAHGRTGFAGEALGIVHRDISPQNVLVEFSGGVKIVDFGVAKSALQLSEQSAIGILKGKAAYMSPEQALGEPVDARTDLFATGIVLFELTTGARLFKAATDIDTLNRVIAESLPAPSSIQRDYPPGLEAVVMRALSRDRAERYQTAREMRLELSRWAESAGVRPSEAAFSDWLENEVPELHAEKRALRGKVRSLASRARSEPPPALDGTPGRGRSLESLAADVVPPSSRRRVTHSMESEPADSGLLSAVSDDDIEATPENLMTFRSSVHTVPPPKRPVRKPRRRGSRIITGVLVLLVVGAGAVLGGWIRIPGVPADRWGLGARVNALVRPGWQRVRGLIARQPTPAPTSVLEIKTGPETASVWLDGRPLPSRHVSVEQGSVHHLRVTAPGCDPLNMELRPTRAVEPVHVVLEPLADKTEPAPSALTPQPSAAPSPKPVHRATHVDSASVSDGSEWRPTGL